MNKLEITKKIVSLVNIETEEAQTTIINAVATWGLLKSENFVELLVNGEIEKASKRATKDELQEIIEYITHTNEEAGSQDNTTSLTKVELVREIDLLRRSKAILRAEFRTIVMKALFPYYELTWTFKTNLFVDLYVGSTLTEKVAKRTRKQYLETIYKALLGNDEPTQETELTEYQKYENEQRQQEETRKMQAAELVDELAEKIDTINNSTEFTAMLDIETRRGFLVAFREWAIENSTNILNHMSNLPESATKAVKLARGELSIYTLELGELARIRIASQQEFTQSLGTKEAGTNE
ncbi:hypothetical protein ACT7C6_11945 [Bacillus paranthracis]